MLGYFAAHGVVRKVPWILWGMCIVSQQGDDGEVTQIQQDDTHWYRHDGG